MISIPTQTPAMTPATPHAIAVTRHAWSPRAHRGRDGGGGENRTHEIRVLQTRALPLGYAALTR